MSNAASDADLAIDRGDLDETLRCVDQICDAREWVELRRVAVRCRMAHERGHQLWPAAMYAEYQLALQGPPELAAAVVTDSPGVFSLGPLAEVAASTHLWEDMSPHLDWGPARNQFAAEAVVRGDVVTSDNADLELPGALQGWEPDYDLAHYEPDRASFPATALPRPGVIDRPQPGRLRTDEGAEHALKELVAPWLTSSEGRCATASVVGTATQAMAALHRGMLVATRLSAEDAIRAMAWTAASGGAQGRRRGGAAGRAITWHAIATLGGDPTWPPHPDDIGEWANELEWWAWDADDEHRGWRLRLAVEDPAHGISWAIDARDAERAAPEDGPS